MLKKKAKIPGLGEEKKGRVGVKGWFISMEGIRSRGGAKRKDGMGKCDQGMEKRGGVRKKKERSGRGEGRGRGVPLRGVEEHLQNG